jgi:hypothetical protein
MSPLFGPLIHMSNLLFFLDLCDDISRNVLPCPIDRAGKEQNPLFVRRIRSAQAIRMTHHRAFKTSDLRQVVSILEHLRRQRLAARVGPLDQNRRFTGAGVDPLSAGFYKGTGSGSDALPFRTSEELQVRIFLDIGDQCIMKSLRVDDARQVRLGWG